MTAKEFFEKNKGEYFDYKCEKVRVVGYGVSCNSVLVTKKEGWNLDTNLNQVISYIDESLISKTDGLWFVEENELTPIEQPELDLCKLLKGCEGMVFYSTMVGYCRLIEVTEFITIGYGDDEYVFLESDGKYSIDGECTIFPSKENRDWSTFVKIVSVKEGDPVMTKWNSAAFWKLENYTKDNKSDFIVPVSDFDFTDFDSNKSKSIV